MKVRSTGAIVIGFAAACISCQLVDNVTRVGTSIGVATGALDEERAAELDEQAEALAKSFRDITPEQEYYIGRSVGAVILDTYQPFENEIVNEYVNTVGTLVSYASQGTVTFGGYHFLVLDSNEINGLAAPGGLIFVTRDLLRLARTEDELAAILAHEVAHVEQKHGLQAIQKSRITGALTDIVVSAGEHSRIERVAELSREFGDSIKDITQTLVNAGYSRAFEKDADIAAVHMLMRLGYDPSGLVRVLRRMNLRLIFSRAGFARTHPRPRRRIKAIMDEIGDFEPNEAPRERTSRFRRVNRLVRRGR